MARFVRLHHSEPGEDGNPLNDLVVDIENIASAERAYIHDGITTHCRIYFNSSIRGCGQRYIIIEGSLEEIEAKLSGREGEYVPTLQPHPANAHRKTAMENEGEG